MIHLAKQKMWSFLQEETFFVSRVYQLLECLYSKLAQLDCNKRNASSNIPSIAPFISTKQFSCIEFEIILGPCGEFQKISYNFVGLPKLLSLYKRGCNSVKDIGIFDHWMFLFIVVDNVCKYFYCFRYVSNFKSKSIFLNQKHDNLNRYCSDLPKFNGLALDWWAGFSWEFMALCHAFWLKFCNLESKKIKAEFCTSTRLLLPSALSPNIYLIDKSI